MLNINIEKPEKMKLGWVIKEKIGPAVINEYAVSKLSIFSKPPPSKPIDWGYVYKNKNVVVEKRYANINVL
jgi:hypothetical protein